MSWHRYGLDELICCGWLHAIQLEQNTISTAAKYIIRNEGDVVRAGMRSDESWIKLKF